MHLLEFPLEHSLQFCITKSLNRFCIAFRTDSGQRKENDVPNSSSESEQLCNSINDVEITSAKQPCVEENRKLTKDMSLISSV